MKDILETLQMLRDSQSPMLLYAILAGILYLGFIYWKSYLSEKSILENKKLKLELIKLGFEIEELRKNSTSSEIVLPKNHVLRDVYKFLDNSERNRFKIVLESFAHNPLKSFIALFSRQFKWLPYFFVSALSSTFFPIVYCVYVLLQKEQNATAYTLHILLFIFLALVLFTAFLGGIFGAIFRTNKTSAFVIGIFAGVPAYFIGWGLLSLSLKIWVIFANAH